MGLLCIFLFLLRAGMDGRVYVRVRTQAPCHACRMRVWGLGSVRSRMGDWRVDGGRMSMGVSLAWAGLAGVTRPACSRRVGSGRSVRGW
jgi:hypothetical protein